MPTTAERVRVGSAAAACSWNARSAPYVGARLVGVFAGHVVAYERAQTRLLVRQNAVDAEDTGTIELPEDVTFASHQDDNVPFVLMWSCVSSLQEEEHETEKNKRPMRTAYVADIKNMSLGRIPVRNSATASGEFQIQDGVVDSSGQHVVLIDTTRGRLWCWSSPQKLKHQVFSSATGEWTQRQLVSDGGVATTSEVSVSYLLAGRLTRSALLGRCFTLVRASWDPSDVATVRIHKWVFDVEMDWKQIERSSTRLPVKSFNSSTNLHEATMQLRMNSDWTHGALAIGNTLIEFSTDIASLSAAKVAYSSVTLEQKIADVAWISESKALAVLLFEGQVVFARRHATGTLKLLDVETQSMTPMKVSWSALLDEDVPTASRLMWIAEQERIFVETGSGCIVFPIKIIRDEAHAMPAELVTSRQTSPQDSARSESSLRSRRRRRTRICSSNRVDEELRRHFEQSASPSAVALLDIARLALFESTIDFQDIFFTLVSIIYQQLKSELQSAGEEEDSYLRLLKTTLSLIFSTESQVLHRVASKILSAPPAFPSRGERRHYYRSEMDELMRIRHQQTTGTIREEQTIVTPSQRAFLNIYLPKIASLLKDLLECASTDNTLSQMKSLFAFCRGVVDDQSDAVLQEAKHTLARISHIHTTNSSSFNGQEAVIRDSLLLIFVSYAMVCSNLCVESVHMDLQHVLSLAQLRQQKLTKREQLACFVTSSYVCQFQSSSSPDSSTSSRASVWNLEIALEFARATQTTDLLVAFCSASKSLLAHECLKEICILQARLYLNSKNLLFETRVEATRQFKALHLHICESYIGEMIGLLREVPLVLQFTHPLKGRHALQSEAFKSSEDVVLQGFEAFTRHILTGTDDVNGDVKKNNSSNCLWECSSREIRVQSRCLRLKSRILWHLRQLVTCDEQSLVQIFERIFLIDFLSGRCGNTEEAKLVAKFIDKAQGAVSCDQWQQKRLSFDSCQQLMLNKTQDNQSHYRVDKVVRSLALLVWAIWIRERCAYCMRSIELLRGHHELLSDKGERVIEDTERKKLGSLAATCALQLNILGILVDKPDDIFALQISLLEEAAKLNPEKAVAVICWAFPADKIQARYLKRYKALRQLLKADSGLAVGSPPIEETEHRCQFIQRHVKRSIRWSITSGSMKPGSAYVESPKKKLEVSRSWTVEIDVLVDCCCDLDFQKVTWALIQKKFAGGSRVTKSQNGGDTRADENANSSSQLEKMLMERRSSTTGGAVSRKEVMILLQEQKRELEDKVRSWAITKTDFKKTEDREKWEVLPSHPTLLQEPSNSNSLNRALTESRGAETTFTIHDIESAGDAREHTSPSRKQSQQIERRDSVQNVLRLLNLRKQRGSLADQRSDSLPNLLNRSGALRSQSQRAAAVTSSSVADETDGVPSPKRHARGSEVYQATTSSTPLSEVLDDNRGRFSRAHSTISITPPLVFPLTHGADAGNNSFMKLLSRTSDGGSMPLKARQFSFQERVPSLKQDDDRAQIWDGSVERSQHAEGEVVSLKTAGAQTDEAPRENKSVEGVKVLAASDHQDAAPTHVRSDATTQSELGGDTTEAGIQCAFKQKKPSESSNLETSSSGGSEGIFNKFPVFVDLNPSSTRANDAPMKFLQIARFSTNSVIQSRNSEEEKMINITPGRMSHLLQSSKNELNQELVDGVQQLKTGSNRTQNLAERLVAHQTCYRNYFTTSESNGKPEEQQTRKSSMPAGRSSLISLKEDMERLKIRLAQLEHCADEIDDDFKDSHHQLDRIEKEHDSYELTATTHLLETIDDTIEDANDGDEDLDHVLATTSVLSRKASRDIDVAKKLIETIEQITLNDGE